MFRGKFRLSDEEDDFFGDVESSRQNLSNIFGVSLDKPQQNVDHSLKYVAPKQTKPILPEPKNSVKSPPWNIQIAKVVTAFKLENQDYVSQGKIGLAVLKNPENEFKIILYRTANKVLSMFTIKEDSKVFLKTPYLQFCDDLNIFWSILFDTAEIVAVLDLLKGKVQIEETTENENQPIQQTEISQEITENKASCSSTDEKVSDAKAQILSRMAKMGQPLPKIAPTNTTDFSDSSDTECRGKLPPNPVVVPRKPKPQHQQIVAVAPGSSSLAPIVTNLSGFSHNIGQDSQYINMLLCESRTQNSEIRMNMSKLETKIEKVLDKIDNIDRSRDARLSGKCKEDEILDLEEKILQLKKENRGLKVQIEQLEDLNTQMPKEEHLRQTDLDEFSDLIKLFSIQTDQLTNSKDFYTNLLNHLNKYCNSLKCEKEFFEKSLNEVKTSFNSLQKEKEQQIEKIIKELELETSKLAILDKVVEELTIENKELTQQKEQCKEETEQTVDTVVKDIMNNLYRTLVTKFGDNESYSSMDILRICGSAIKQETNNAFKKKTPKD